MDGGDLETTTPGTTQGAVPRWHRNVPV